MSYESRPPNSDQRDKTDQGRNADGTKFTKAVKAKPKTRGRKAKRTKKPSTRAKLPTLNMPVVTPSHSQNPIKDRFGDYSLLGIVGSFALLGVTWGASEVNPEYEGIFALLLLLHGAFVLVSCIALLIIFVQAV